MHSAYAILLPDRSNALYSADNPGEVIELVLEQVLRPADDQDFSDAIQDDWDDEELRLEVFGPHFTEETLKDTLDLCEYVEAISKGYIL
jgi:hypothetical protein